MKSGFPIFHDSPNILGKKLPLTSLPGFAGKSKTLCCKGFQPGNYLRIKFWHADWLYSIVLKIKK